MSGTRFVRLNNVMAFADFRAMLMRNVRVDNFKVDGLPAREVEEDVGRAVVDLH